MADELAKVLTIPDSVTQKMDDVIEKINEIESASNKMAQSVNENYKVLANGDINSYIGKLSSIQSIVQSLSGNKASLKIEGLDTTTTEAERLATSTSKVATTLNNTAPARKYAKELREVNNVIELQADAQERLIKASQRNVIPSPTSALEYAKQAQTYAQQVQAIRYLETAYKQLGNTEADVAKKGELATAMRGLREQVRAANEEMGRTQTVMRQLSNWGEQLSRAFALAFSVSQIRGYIMELATVRGEFEKTQVALTSILQNKDRADKLFSQVTELATKSPYTLKELTTYTKQLAAYQIEYKNLYTTTKMLADVSAGLGVDMSRLILAFGQVRAANFLRGTEVRQFTEAGLDILGELAKYYTELEGKIVSVGDVQDRVTKRMVAFGDVEEVFKRVTAAGGIFYNMQERQAQTLAGQMSNLQDRIDIMLNEIGKSNEGVLKGVVSLLAEMVENWEVVAEVIKAAAIALVLYKTNLLAVTQAQQRLLLSQYAFNLGGLKMVNVFSLMKNGLKLVATGFKIASAAAKSFLAANAPLLALSLVFDLITSAIGRYKDQQEALTEASNKYVERTIELRNLKDEYDSINNSVKRVNESDADFAKRVYDQKIASLGKYKTKLQDLGLSEAVVETAFALGEGNIDEQIANAMSLAKQMAKWENQTASAIANVNSKWRLFGDNFDDDAKDLSESLDKLLSATNTSTEGIAIQFDKLKHLFSEQDVRKISELITPKQEGESEIDYANRLAEGYQIIIDSIRKIRYGQQDIWEANKRDLKDLRNNARDFVKIQEDAAADWTEYRKELKRVIDEMSLLAGGEEALVKQFKENPLAFEAVVNRKLADAQVSEFLQQYTGQEIAFALSIDHPDPSAVEDAEKEYKEYLKRKAEEAEAERQKAEDAKRAEEAQKQQAAALKESLSLVRKMGDAYDKLESKLGKSNATLEIRNRYEKDLIDSLSKAGVTDTAFIADMTFNPEGIISALEKVTQAVAAGSKTDVENVIKEIRNEWRDKQIDIEFDANTAKLEQSLDDAISKYELGKELSKLGLGEGITEQLFGIEALSLDDIREMLSEQKQLYTNTNGDIADEYVKIFADAEKKIGQLQDKETRDRIEKYASYLKRSVSERIRIEQDAAKKIAEVEAENRFSRSQKDAIKSNIQKETQEALDKLAWDDFKSSGMYIDLFENLDQASTQAIDNMLTELEKMRTSLSELSPEQLKEIIVQIEKLREIKIEEAGFRELVNNIRDGVKAARELPKLERQLQDARDTQKSAERERDALARQRKVAEDAYSLAVKTYGVESDQAKRAKIRLQIAEDLLAVSNNQVENGKEQIDNLSEQVNLIKLQKKLADSSISEMLNKAAAIGDSINNLHGALTDVFGELPVGLENAFVYTEGLFAGISDFEKGLSDIMSGKVLSGAINTIAGLFRTIGGLFGIGLRDARREREIEREIELIDSLQESYEKLEEAIDSAFSANKFDQAQQVAEANLRAQTQALDRAIAAEEDKKNSDGDRIKEWRAQIEDNMQALKDLEMQAVSVYGGFGTSGNLKSAAEDFVSAWLDAFNETGAGLDALSDKMDEWLNNAIQRQLLMRLSDQYITPLLEQFDAMFSETSDQGRIMTKEEIDAWRRLYEENSKAFDDKAKAYLDALDIKPTGIESEMSGLQRGIEGVTETTAQALEALLNSMRFYVSDSNNLLRQFYMSFISADETMNPMLYELKQHTTLLNAIHTLLNSTTKMTNNNGRALKVLMM